MKRRCLLDLLVATLVLGWARPPQASLLTTMSLRELVASSDQIVVAKVISVQTAWDASHRKIFSTIDVDIEQTWKGEPARRISIVQPGGAVGDIEMTVGGMPGFALSERTLLFLHGRSRPQVVGMSQGKRTLVRDSQSGRWFLQAPDMTCVVERGTDAKLRHVQRTAPVDLDDFRAQVESFMRQ
jgi:hypothetical protein